MRVLVTGAAGFIGSHLCDRFLADGHEVLGIDNFATGRKENLQLDHRGFMFAERDIGSTDLTRFLEEDPSRPDGYLQWFSPELIVHCAASYDDRDKWHRDTNTNVNGAINVAIAARACEARVVYFQTALIYGNNPYARPNISTPEDITWSDHVKTHPLPVDTLIKPENSYAISKYAAGQYLRHADIPLLELRLANIYGPRNLSGPIPTFYKRLAAGENCTIVDSRRDFVYIADLVELVVQGINEDATGVFHVSTGRDYPIGQLYDLVVDAMGKYGSDLPAFQERGPDDAPTILLDPSQTKAAFGWEATTDLDEGINEAVAWYQEHGVQETFTHLAVRG